MHRAGGEELEMAVSVPVRILGVPRSPDPAASGSEETSWGKKKKKEKKPSPARSSRSAERGWVRWRRRIVPKGVGRRPRAL